MSEPPGGQLSEHGPLGPSQPATDPPATPPAPEVGLAAMTVVVGFFGLVASLVVLGSIAEGVRDQEVFALDNWATPFLHGISSPGLDAFMNGVTDIGSIYVIPVLFVVVVGWLIWRKRYRAACVHRSGQPRQPGAAGLDEAVLRPSSTAAPVGRGPA